MTTTVDLRPNLELRARSRRQRPAALRLIEVEIECENAARTSFPPECYRHWHQAARARRLAEQLVRTADHLDRLARRRAMTDESAA
ncbi:MAG: hypothetical protein AAGA90_23710 [Actinomycetota bacterium]